MHEIWSQLKPWIESGEQFALATVVSARNPSPRGIGSVLAISEKGDRFIGSVSAGCVETEVIEMAVACVADGKTRWAEFGPSQGFPWEVAFSCGGKISVRVERFECGSEMVAALVQLHETHGTGIWISGENQHALVQEDGPLVGNESEWDSTILAKARENLSLGENTEELETAQGRVLLRMISQPYRLFIVGAGHISLHLVHFAKALNYQTIVIDPRESFANEERFETPPDHLVREWPETAFSNIQLSAFDSVVMLTHDPKIDDQALGIVLKSEASYIGALGSRRSHEGRLKRLAAAGFEETDLDHIHGPVGLDIGSSTPAEIAVSIIAQIVQVKNNGDIEKMGLTAEVAENTEK
jgi:xanthine dehydrogenase accessory factor